MQLVNTAILPIRSSVSSSSSLDSSQGKSESNMMPSSPCRRAVALDRRQQASTRLVHHPAASSHAIGHIVVGEMVGTGGFCEVLKVKCLTTSSQAKQEEEDDDELSPCPTEELFLYEHVVTEEERNPLIGGKLSFVIKRLKEQTLAKKSLRQMGIADMMKEAKVLASLPRHDNIIKLHGVSLRYWDLEPSMRQDGFLLLELVDKTLDQCLDSIQTQKRGGSSIFQFNRRRKFILETQGLRIRDFALSVAKALRFVHKNEYAYRDLKPANIGVTYDKNGRPIVKLLDFGLARSCTDWVTGIPGNDSAGTARYMSPEVALGLDHGLASDVHSFAMVLFQILALQKPYANAVSKTFIHQLAVKEQCRPNLQKVQSQTVRDLLSSCWSPDPRIRPNFDFIVATLNDCGKRETVIPTPYT